MFDGSMWSIIREMETYPEKDMDTENMAVTSNNVNAMDSDKTVFRNIFDHDTRPTFVVELACCVSQVNQIPIVYCNPALRQRPSLEQYSVVLPNTKEVDGGSADFTKWVLLSAQSTDPVLNVPSFCFSHSIWTAFRSQNKYLVMSGLPQAQILKTLPRGNRLQDTLSRALNPDQMLPAADTSSTTDHTSDLASCMTSTTLPQSRTPQDWSDQVQHDDNTNPDLPDHTTASDLSSRHQNENSSSSQRPPSAADELFQSINWASTALGPREDWSPDLVAIANLVMSDPSPSAVAWGEELIVIHNQAISRLFPKMKDNLMGNTVKNVLPEIWKSFSIVFNTVRSSRRAVMMEDVPLILDRDDRPTEAFLSYRFLPVQDRLGHVLGVYQSEIESTKEVLYRRRLSTLLRITSCSANVTLTDTKVFWQRLLDALSGNKEDVGFALLYSVQEPHKSSPETLSDTAQQVCVLEGVLGVPDGHVSAATALDLPKSQHGYAPAFRLAAKGTTPTFLHVDDDTMPQHLVDGIACRGYASGCQGAVVCPVRPTGSSKLFGFLVIGISSTILYDDTYRQFVEILDRQVATSMASVVLLNDELAAERQKTKEAALVHASLQQRLEQKTKELVTSESKFQRMIDKSGVGISILNRSGTMTYANQTWYTMMGHSGSSDSKNSWHDLIYEEDKAFVGGIFAELTHDRKDICFEVRLKKDWTKQGSDAQLHTSPTWILVSAYVEEGDNGDYSLVSGVTDISQQKWAEEFQRKRVAEALEMKAQQEEFIDTVSHEMRNPLSAIFHSADAIYAALLNLKTDERFVIDDHQNINMTLDNAIEAVETILLCGQHQKHIIDDVLTLSKMNANMLTICPEDVDPTKIVDGVVRMFSGDAKKAGVSLITDIDASVKILQPSQVALDPNRFSQILVNLVGNAIKFTQSSTKRQVSIIVRASTSRPLDGDCGVKYLAATINTCDTNGHDEGMNEVIYWRVAVQDTGVGMTEAEMSHLFSRFQQASPRTHKKYGGSGLGLFISKKLSEMQGGAIGLTSRPGVGSTFAFYVATRRSKINPERISSSPLASPTLPGSDAKDTITEDSAPQDTKAPLAILVVEDNLLNQRVLCKQLRAKGYVVYAANHGADACSFLEGTKLWKGNEKNGQPLSVILLDVEMPIMDGLTCARKIRQLEKEGILTRYIPIISASANARAEQLRDATDAGMDDHVVKPFHVADLIMKMEKLVKAHPI